uniref:Uncharacterized protein n=1 Tax=Siphoviridae sp. ctnPP24 TaxID=2825662 RepID=A0A8S5TZ78_9CAUD|nr:MAG TPA: hypothetical protein [Siphoviridae sp. ctnPP24]
MRYNPKDKRVSMLTGNSRNFIVTFTRPKCYTFQ